MNKPFDPKRRQVISGMAATALMPWSSVAVVEDFLQAPDGTTADNAMVYATRFLDGKRVLSATNSGRLPVLGCIYGMAATIERADGTPVAVACVDGHDPIRKHRPVLWAYPLSATGGIAPTKGMHPKNLVEGWDLTGKCVRFGAEADGFASHLERIVHPWQDKRNIPLLSDIDRAAIGGRIEDVEDSPHCSAFLKLTQGVLETGVPWSTAGKVSLWRYPSICQPSGSCSSGSEPLAAISDNELWSFQLPADSKGLDVWFREKGKRNARWELLTTFKPTPTGIAFFVSNDLPVGPKFSDRYSPVSRDSRHFWLLTSRHTNDGHPVFGRTVYGHEPPEGAANDGEPHCARGRIALRPEA